MAGGRQEVAKVTQERNACSGAVQQGVREWPKRRCVLVSKRDLHVVTPTDEREIYAEVPQCVGEFQV